MTSSYNSLLSRCFSVIWKKYRHLRVNTHVPRLNGRDGGCVSTGGGEEDEGSGKLEDFREKLQPGSLIKFGNKISIRM